VIATIIIIIINIVVVLYVKTRARSVHIKAVACNEILFCHLLIVNLPQVALVVDTSQAVHISECMQLSPLSVMSLGLVSPWGGN